MITKNANQHIYDGKKKRRISQQGCFLRHNTGLDQNNPKLETVNLAYFL